MGKKNTSIGCLFWVALILLVIVIVLFNLKQIDQVVKTIGLDKFFTTLFKQGVVSQKPVPTEKKPEAKAVQPQQDKELEIVINQNQQNTPAPEPQKTTEKTPDKVAIEVHNQEKAKTDEKQDNKNTNLRNANLFFTKINQDGKISFVPVKRAINYSDSPLKSTILNLLKGPSSQEVNSGLLNLIPANTELKNIYIRGNTAYLDFNESFRFNTLGKEGLKAQLQQIVYTCTEFINVNNVQILIDNQVVDYLGPEGVYIGQPLTRDSF